MAISQLAAQNRFYSNFRVYWTKKFPIYLLDTWNQRIRQILGTVIGLLPTQTSNTLCHLFQLQQVEIVLQNALHSHKCEITIRLREHMRMRITNFGAFLRFKKQLATTYGLWERAHQKMPDQHSSELRRQLIDSHLVSTNSLGHGLPWTELSCCNYFVNTTVAAS